ncbi:MAG: Uma2 family endonuclease [Bryobacteraceae bacterium]|nr:Uma2 family endonuclease [Bryobacteraceae bacterium]
MRETRFEKKKLWTRVEALALIETLPDLKVELIEGELYEKMGQLPPHIFFVNVVKEWAAALFGQSRLRVQQSMKPLGADEDTSEPEPDLLVSREAFTAYRKRLVEPSDVLLLIEVAHTSVRKDLDIKAPLYARNGIADYWVLDADNMRLIVHRDPAPDGYRSIRILTGEDSIAPLAAPEKSVKAIEL